MRSLANRSLAAISLAWQLVFCTITSGLQTLRIILRTSYAVTPGFVDYDLQPMGATATTVLASLICLTPGTTAVDVSPSRGRLRLHLLDVEQRDGTVRDIREHFEPLVRTLFERGPIQ